MAIAWLLLIVIDRPQFINCGFNKCFLSNHLPLLWHEWSKKTDYLLPNKTFFTFCQLVKKNHRLWSLFTFLSCILLYVSTFFNLLQMGCLHADGPAWTDWLAGHYGHPNLSTGPKFIWGNLQNFKNTFHLYMPIRHCWRVQHEIKISFGQTVHCISLYSLLVLKTKGLTPHPALRRH